MGINSCRPTNSPDRIFTFKEETEFSIALQEKLTSFAQNNLQPSGSRVRVKRRLWDQQMLTKLLVNTQEWMPGYELTFNNNGQPNLIYQIEDIRFPTLKKINLSGNNVTSVVGLCRVWLPNLQILQLGSRQTGNDITNINSLRKMYCPYLFDIVLYKNKMRESNAILKMQSEKLRFFYLQDKLNEVGNDCDLRWVMKLQHSQPFILDISYQRRINQMALKQLLHEKIQKLNLYSQ